MTPATDLALLCGLLCGLLGAITGCSRSSCTPEDHGLGDATRLAPRELPGRAPTAEPCSRPRLEVLTSDAELTRLNDELSVTKPEPVDFTRERVIVREGPANEAIAWTVARDDAGVIGLLSCGGVPKTGCVVNVIAVPALITRADSRTCDPVGCGGPQTAPVSNR